ncbi:hypothetical protein I7I51_07251 [Histoplasma capsulatum]|uniref:Uncharacterized protein n=1 Tax=Ajellomyces capsulatus TaxID=5037 RepID=A0A8A1MNT3_AJECA|nr:predicted protein [Histoplasma mississippiense (nom. inval.)]EDN09934.1 predicted protein [Histoplasma mississippiense (nom. inval.)]QSS66394.1 hypothetical protein I7I51_07251 [Histoplasma capsulatum]
MATFRFASARISMLVPRAHQNLPYHSFFNLTAAQLQVSKTPFPAAASALLRRSFVTDRKQPETPAPYEIENDPDGRYSINTERHEYSKSGSDNAVAEQRAAWDLSYITPEMVREASLDEAMHDGHNEAARRGWVEKGPSRRVSPPKGMKVDYSGTVVIEKKETLIKLPTK